MPSISNLYTQVFSYTTATGGLTPTQYFALNAGTPPAGSAYVIKYLSVASSTGWVGTPAQSVSIFSSDDNAGTNAHPFVSTSWGSSPTTLTVYDVLDAKQSVLNTFGAPLGNQIILNQPYIGVDVNMNGGGGTFYVTVSYVLIPSTNPAVANFATTHGTASVGGTGITTLIPASTTNTLNVKSILFANTLNDSFTVQMLAYNTGTATIAGYLMEEFTITPYSTGAFVSPFYMPQLTQIVPAVLVTGTAATALNYYSSYCLGAS